MDKVLLDTNIAIDYLSAGRPEHADAVLLMEGLMESVSFEPCILVSSVKDIYYILCQHYRNEELVRERLNAFCSIVTLLDASSEMLGAAFASDKPDLEDGIVRAAAELTGARAIVTRDASAFTSSDVPSMDARSFLMRFADEL